MYSYVSVCYSYVSRMSVVCIRMYPYVPYVTRMYSCGVLVMIQMLHYLASKHTSQGASVVKLSPVGN